MDFTFMMTSELEITKGGNKIGKITFTKEDSKLVK